MTAPATSSPDDQRPVLSVRGLSKAFRLHLQGGVELPVVEGVAFDVAAGECVVLSGASGAGKSSVLKMIAGSYRPAAGEIRLRVGEEVVDLAALNPRPLAAVRRRSIGHVTQFFRVIPRVSALEAVAEPLLRTGTPREKALSRAARLLTRLGIGERLHPLPPATFSGGEKQRVNIARGLARRVPLLLLDEPTAALDRDTRAAVIDLLAEARAEGAAILAVFHDEDVRAALADRTVDIAPFRTGVM